MPAKEYQENTSQYIPSDSHTHQPGLVHVQAVLRHTCTSIPAETLEKLSAQVSVAT